MTDTDRRTELERELLALAPDAQSGVVAPAPTGVRSPASIEVNLNTGRPLTDTVPGVSVPALVDASLPVPITGPINPGPFVPPSVETRGPLVPLVPLAEVHPSTVESAIEQQRLPNDQIHGVFEDADGVKRDALGHPFSAPPTPPRKPAKTRGIGFDT